MSTPFTVIIPARLASSRLPEKALVDIAGKPMVVRVAERAKLSEAQRIVVATDHTAIAAACSEYGIEAVLTGKQHTSGTARLAEAALLLGMADSDIAVNVQGDEPLIDPALINRTAELLGSSSAQMATAAHPIADVAEFLNPNCVKVVLDQRRNALYFSRAPIAWPRDAFAETQAVLPEGFAPLRHIGLYAYRVGFLHQYVGLPPSPLESIESLEQLRVLWHGGKIAVTVCDNAPAAGVDTAEDLQRVRDWFARHPEEAS
ncbi:3-deoxy-manno-octulosonate cytidylyltransferase [Eikenella corrodens]|uniref:3-deoxy-manno-octulosonate cytidylyltransferase n=3 Tax=Eikenella corrodens TaxID=539 RepID=C0DS20_EIKCO|nr:MULTISPECIES: 3-deoxy-manno-octulosonate cytidylyltransferase [Eikenella]EEG25138.1 3-deoxy-D-manno-octulosonate cytidylyltransferase [Eikenella corrodens ATCC 23834]OAM15093.1 3-deoxy-manno-octulosonate cytidylyltransferase [Eikenella corrodens]OFN58215.1 3-deoxy-manno-octulosonate cytidylyltransferase [Eikenella sp. HMSC061C02]OWP24410.1 3-deoxy-manno-octulosonate cytidylyltransferase [Eikenella corrodens]UAK74297.1 3-deoxy-manno-octulosonate cytidylyltransferase [Eikenella corrodens]